MELRARLTAVEKAGFRKPERADFESFALDWLATYPEKKGLKRSTVRSYGVIVRNHLVPAFGSLQLSGLTVDGIERHLVAMRKKGLAPASCNRQLNVLSLIVRSALRRDLMTSNPVPLVDRPKEQLGKWRILSPVAVVQVERSFDVLIEEAETDRDRDDRRVARLMFLTMMGTGVRRGELLGLRWRTVSLADPDGAKLRVEETWVRAGVDTPKSRAGHRTIALGRRLAEELAVHLGRTPFQGDDERVFAERPDGARVP